MKCSMTVEKLEMYKACFLMIVECKV